MRPTPVMIPVNILLFSQVYRASPPDSGQYP
jgi:hypothetical protein